MSAPHQSQTELRVATIVAKLWYGMDLNVVRPRPDELRNGVVPRPTGRAGARKAGFSSPRTERPAACVYGRSQCGSEGPAVASYEAPGHIRAQAASPRRSLNECFSWRKWAGQPSTATVQLMPSSRTQSSLTSKAHPNAPGASGTNREGAGLDCRAMTASVCESCAWRRGRVGRPLPLKKTTTGRRYQRWRRIERRLGFPPERRGADQSGRQ